ncbi:helix-turn-helix transcriptional regulator [Chitinophaga filiformis]|uniref:winged helix-turn-helix transcriptional regulator n=1 Tax=Chitinophaga filiformis TaxID=104663 RepID=UPI001F1B52C9|nr:helix-turn-helix domain-containing protein [Chitinophaga filiformis]MCF6404512.1 helix-turn-helix transcriptional regulator [Chitinophaga filiformis]
MKNDEQIKPEDLSCAEKLQAMGDSLYVIGGKWKLRVIIALSQGHSRFNDLQRTITGISGKVLSGELKELELNGLVKRKVQAGTIPVIVEYELTPYSQTLKDVVYGLIKWGVLHREKIKSEGKLSNV